MVEINKVRADPTSLIANLTAIKDNFNGLVYKELGVVAETTIEGVAAIDAAIDYLNNTATVSSALTEVTLMTTACSDHVADTGPGGETGNTGADGSTPTERVNRYGISNGTIVQNNGYKRITGADVVLWMIIDDGVSARTNRDNLLNSTITVAGIFSGTHSVNGHQSCVVLAPDFTPD